MSNRFQIIRHNVSKKNKTAAVYDAAVFQIVQTSRPTFTMNYVIQFI